MKKFKYHELKNMTVVLDSQEDYDLSVMRGKVIVNEEDHLMTFEQNRPRGPKSAELMRTPHSRLVRRQDGSLSLRFHFAEGEPGIDRQLLRELKAVIEALGINAGKRVA